MLTLENLVGQQEDWANYITNVETRDTPLMDWLPVDKKPITNTEYQYQAERWATPAINSHVDGKPWTAFSSVGEGRGVLKAVIQWFDKTGSISKLSQEVSDIAGIADQMAREIPKKMSEMRTDMETNFCDDHDSRDDNKVVGYLTRAVGKWISDSAQSDRPVPSDFRPPAASIVTTATASVTENSFRDLLQSMVTQTKRKEEISGFVGVGLKRRFSDFQFYLPSSSSTQASGVNFEQSGTSRAIVRAVDRYDSDFGPLTLMLSFWLAAITGDSTVQANRGYFLHRSMWKIRWKQKPKVYKPEFKGGSYEFAMDAILMLVCLNPKGEGKYAPTA